jgi:hypothetical protein
MGTIKVQHSNPTLKGGKKNVGPLGTWCLTLLVARNVFAYLWKLNNGAMNLKNLEG